MMSEDHQRKRGTEIVDGEIAGTRLLDLCEIPARNRYCSHT